MSDKVDKVLLETRLRQLREGLAELQMRVHHQQGAIAILEQLLAEGQEADQAAENQSEGIDEDSGVGK